MNATDLRKSLLAAGLADDTSIQGCSPRELAQIECAAGRPLPTAYKEFMAHFGKCAGRLLRDVEMFYPSILELRENAIEILEDRTARDVSLPACSFVFGVRNYEQFVCFSDLSDDPPVQLYVSGDPEFITVASSFWDFISKELEQCERYYRQVKGTPYDLRP